MLKYVGLESELTLEVFALDGAVLVVLVWQVLFEWPTVLEVVWLALLVVLESLLVSLVTIKPLLRFLGQLNLLWVEGVAWLSEFSVAMCEVALLTQCAVLVGLIVAAPLGLVLVVDLVLVLRDILLHAHVVVHVHHLGVGVLHVVH